MTSWLTAVLATVLSTLQYFVHADNIVSNSTTVTSSSVLTIQLNGGSITLIPEWAIQADSSTHWTNCFMSEMEIRPWWKIDLNDQREIRNVRVVLLPHDRVNNVPPDTDFREGDLNNLTIYVSNSSQRGVQCGDRWSFHTGHTAALLFNCSVYGRFVSVTTDTDIGNRSLGLCSVVINEQESDSLPGLSTATVRVSSADGATEGSLVTDGDVSGLSSHCFSSTAETNPWLRINFLRVYYVDGVQTQLYGSDGDGVTVYVGRSLLGYVGNVQCGKAAAATMANESFWHNVTCEWPQFAQYIYIGRSSGSTEVTLKVCEVKVTVGSFLDIYNPATAFASSQENVSSPVWKAIDGSLQNSNIFGCYASQSATPNASWTIQLPDVAFVSTVTVLHLNSQAAKSAMIGSTVQVRESKDTTLSYSCGSASSENSTEHTAACPAATIGRYVSIVAGSSNQSQLSLCEVQVNGCYVSPLLVNVSSENVTLEHNQSVDLSCTAVGCPLPVSLNWTDANDRVVTEKFTTDGEMLPVNVSLGGVNATGGKSMYKCSANNGIETKTIEVEVVIKVAAKVTKSPANLTYDRNSSQTLNCSAEGYPAPEICWEFPNNATLCKTTRKSDTMSESTIELTNLNPIQHGGVYTCKANNGHTDETIFLVQFKDEVTREPMPQILDYGGSLNLSCDVTGYPVNDTVTWFKDGRPLDSGDIKDNVNENRTAVVSSIVLYNVTQQTCGTYSCLSLSSRSAIISLNSSIVGEATTSNNDPDEQDTVTLSCYAVGCPQPVIVWQYRRQTIDEFSDSLHYSSNHSKSDDTVGSRLEIKKINRSDTGYYRCCARNSPNGMEHEHCSTEILIEVKFNVTFKSHPIPMMIEEGQLLNLSCSVASHPLPTVTWLFERKVCDFKGTEKLNASRNVPRNSVLTSFLEFSVSRNDSGSYSCMVEHQMSKPAQVSVKGHPGTIPSKNISVVLRNVGLVTVSWSPPCEYFSPITHFLVSYALDSNDSQYILADNVSLNSNNVANVSGLLPYEDYFVKIVAVNNIGSSSFVPVPFRSPPGYSSAPLNFSNGAIGPTSVVLLWKKPEVPNGDVQKYRVNFLVVERQGLIEKRESVYHIEEFSGDNSSGILSRLEPYTTYTLELRAVNRIGSLDIIGNASNQLIVTTAEAAPSMPRQVSVSLIENRSDSLLVGWDVPSRPNGKIRLYRVYYTFSSVLFSSITPWKHETNSSETSAVITGLLAFTSYQFVVQAVTDQGGNRSQPKNGTTDESQPSSPQRLNVSSKSANSVDLSWLPPEFPRGNIRDYRIDYSGKRTLINGETLEHRDHVLIRGHPPNTHTMVGNLRSGFIYNFSVKAATVKGFGPSIALESIEIIAAKPVAPSRPGSLVSSETTITVQLIRPNDNNGKIDYIQLIVAEIPDGQTVDNITFELEPLANYSANLMPGKAYITAQWIYENMKDSMPFVVGNGSFIGGFFNGPLKTNAKYGIVLKAITKGMTEALISFSTPLTADTKSRSSSSDNSGAVIAGVLVTLIIILVIVLVVILFIRRRRSQKSSYNGPVVYGNEHADISLGDFKKPSITACSNEVIVVAGNCALLEVEVTGDPHPKITWKYGGRDLPGNDGRLKVLSDGSLQLIGSGFGDSGMYRCLASNRLGSAHCQIKLRVEPSAEDIAIEHEPIPVAQFEDYVAEMHESRNEEFSAEFSFLAKQTNVLSSEASRLECNQGKNRYGNIFPYDHTRVVLATIEGVPGSDYINASYLNAIDGPRGYIAAQGPNEQTTDDFWRMIWQEKVEVVVMLTNLEEKERVKCHKYWPEVGWEYDSILVTLQHELAIAESVTRCFSLTRRLTDGSRQERTLHQFHFVDWPDHGIPDNSTAILRFLKRVRAQYNQLKPKGPMVAHCSAGVGRTGTFIAIDYTIQKIKKDGEIDLFNLVNDMRQSRPAMVQTEAQYIFCHDAVLDYIRCGETEVSAGSLQSHIQELYKVDQSVGVSGIRHELQLLNKVSPPKSLFKFSAALDQANIYKNRYSDILAADDHRVNLEAVPGHPAHSTYINATFVDGYTRHNMYITTQGPVTNTIPDFWRMLWEQDSDMIVMLTELHEDGSTMCARYWPSQGTGDYDLFSVILEHEKSYGDYVIRKLQVANKKESSVRSVTQFHYTCWHNNHVPQSASSLIEIIGRVDRTQLHAGTSPLIVVCNDGVGRSGTYCAISIIIDRLKTEQVVDVFQVVKAMRIHNPGYIARLEDYQFCYNAAAEFLEAFDTYANFKSS